MRKFIHIAVLAAMVSGFVVVGTPLGAGAAVTPATQPVCSSTVHAPCVFQGFEIDGNTSVDVVTGTLDWQSPPPNLTHFTDGTGTTDDIFSSGSKELSQSTWTCTAGSAPAKGDIFPGGDLSFRTVTVGGAPHQVVDADFTRVGSGGDAHVDYEFNKATQNLTTGGCTNLPLRSVGDILVAFDSNTGGSSVAVTAYRWNGSTFVQLNTGSEGVTFEGVENGITTNGVTSFSDPGLAAGQYGEAGLDLTATIGNLTCGEFGSAYMKTRSSSAINSEVKDRTQVLPFNPAACPSSSLVKAVRDDTTNPTGAFAATTSAKPGDTLEYQLTYTNSGSSQASNVVVTDPVPANTTYVSCSGGTSCSQSGGTVTWSLGNVGAHTSATLGFTVKLASVFPNGATPVTNTATATTTEEGSKSSNPVTATVNAAPNLTVTKKADATSVNSGSPIGFTMSGSNGGNAPAANATLSDTLPTGAGLNWKVSPTYNGPGTCAISGTAPAQQTLNCSFGTLNVGATYTVHVQSGTTAATSGTFSNTAVVQATGSPPQQSGDMETVNQPNLVATKTPDATSVSSGSSIGYTITVTNTATAGVATGVTLTDAPPAGNGVTWSIGQPSTGSCVNNGTATVPSFSCTFGDLQPGAVVSVHISGSTSATTSGTIVNTAVIQGTNTPPVTPVGSETVNKPNLTVAKKADAASVNSGDPIGFTLTVNNAGPGVATGATLSDPLPSVTGVVWSIDQQPSQGSCSLDAANNITCSFGDVAASTTVTVHVAGTTTAASSGTLNNKATVQSTNSAPMSSTASITINQPHLSVVKKADAASVSTGTPIGFTITVTSTGPGTAEGATLVDNLPGNAGLSWSVSPAYTGPGTCSITGQQLTCSFGNLAPGAVAVVHVSSPTTGATAAPGTSVTVSNTAVAQANNTGGGTPGTGMTIVNAPNVTIGKSAVTGTVQGGSQIAYLITVTNSGPGTATNTVVSDALPTNGGLNWSVSPAVAGCSITGVVGAQSLSCTFATLGIGTVNITVVSGTTPATCGTVTNNGATVTVGNQSPQPVAAGSASVTVACAPNLSLHKAANVTQGQINDTITYTLQYTNSGNGDAASTTISEIVPTGTAFASCSTPCSTTGTPVSNVTWNTGTVAGNGGTGSVTMSVTVVVTVGCQICNTATISSPSQNGGAPISSNQLCLTGVPAPQPQGAHANGSAFGIHAQVLGLTLINTTLVQASSSVSGVGADSHSDQLLTVSIPAVLTAGVVRAQSTSVVTSTVAQARDTSVAETANVNVLAGLVTANVIRAVASTQADGGSSSFSTAGSEVTGLQVAGLAYGLVTQTLQISLNPLLFGANSGVTILGTSGKTGQPAAGVTSGGTYSADVTSTAIQVHITGILGIIAPTDVTISQAVSHSDFPQTTICGATSPLETVSGHAFIASLDTTPSLAPTVVGFAGIPAIGGHAHAATAGLNALPVAGAGVATADSLGTISGTQTSSISTANVANVCLLQGVSSCLISADAVTSTSSSTASKKGATSTDAGTQFLNVKVLGLVIPVNVAPNATIDLPGIGFVVLNEQFCDGGGAATHTCAGANHSGLTVRGIDVVVDNFAQGGILPIGAQVIVAEAHSDATFGP